MFVVGKVFKRGSSSTTLTGCKGCNMNLEVLNQLAPEKKKYVRGNQKPLIRKQLSKETINRSILCNRTEDIAAYFFCENLRVL